MWNTESSIFSYSTSIVVLELFISVDLHCDTVVVDLHRVTIVELCEKIETDVECDLPFWSILKKKRIVDDDKHCSSHMLRSDFLSCRRTNNER
ncbi:hypothetical protein RCL_jg20332.t1 [Rhizophagus clarus]|uniref:Uncharacterized protein n=1 Tax=Rhizophagus clarus TaxID=94130 RepID=A0A8H3KZ58_9GLOM|nr:hypothetical protein RCL_jg20332.t1 [Rhizophagus clarus]